MIEHERNCVYTVNINNGACWIRLSLKQGKHQMTRSERRLALRLCSATAIAGLCVLPSTQAFAQSTPAVAVEEIVVTARKREESLQEVPLSISAFTEKTIEAAGITDIEDISRLTPGFTFAPLFGGAAATPVIRGQSTTIGEPNVGFFVDGVYQSSRAIMDASLGDDVARVEIVKGPQGALYGRNTFGGAVNIITRAPSDTLEGRVEASYGDGNTIGLKGSVSGPLVEDQLYFRLGATYRSSDGYFTNSLTGGNLDTRETTVIAGSLEYRATDALSLRLRVAREDTSDGDAPIAFAANNGRPANLTGAPFPAMNQMFIGELRAPTSFAVTPGHTDRTVTATSLTADWDLGGATLTSITGYNDVHLDFAVDNDYSAVNARFANTLSDITEVSQELRLASSGEGPFQWLAGVYYYKQESDTHLEDFWGPAAYTYASNLALPGGVRRQLLGGLINDLHEETESYAAYGLIRYAFTEKLSVSAEARWTSETKSVDSTDASQLTGLVTGTYVNSRDFENVLPRYTIDYQLTPDALIYASASKGEKVGGFNVVTVAGGILPSERTYDPESAWNYEIGTKTTWYDGRLVLNLAAYQIDWSNQIVRALGATFATLNTNAGKTTVKGVELEMRAKPADGLELGAGVAYTDSSYDKYTFGTLALLGMNPVLDGTRLQYVSTWQSNFSVQYVFPVSDGVEWFSRADFSYQSDQSAVQTADAYTGSSRILNLRTGLDFGNTTVRLFVNNALDEDSALVGTFVPSAAQHLQWVQGAVGAGPLTGLAAFGAVVTARPPRTWGASVSVRF
jgi:iron complex outermembrane receptor protein